MKQNSEQPKKKKGLWIALLLVSLLVLIGVGVKLWLDNRPDDSFDASDYHVASDPTLHTDVPTAEPTTETVEPTTETAPVTESTEPVESTDALPDNPIDFYALHDRNPDAYAWIYIPLGEGKDIDYPILHPRNIDDDNYYLHHNIDRKYQFSGCIYTQRWNGTDFSDRVTLVYGHNMLNGTMFTNLTYFQNQAFFDEHDTFYIYMPNRILTYRIVAAIQFDTRHILRSFDFSDDTVYENWIQNYILNPKAYNRSVREGAEVTVDDKIVILSTCLEHGKYRYLVQGVLISDEPTN